MKIKIDINLHNELMRFEREKAHNKQKYEPPMSYEEIVEKMGKKKAKMLAKDPVHKWRMDTGIELIHYEPTEEELDRIWENWQLMDKKMKETSDEASIRFFKIKNRLHYILLKDEYG